MCVCVCLCSLANRFVRLAAFEETDDSKAKPIDNEEVLGSTKHSLSSLFVDFPLLKKSTKIET